MKSLNPHFISYLVIFVVSLVVFHFSYGLEILDFQNIAWLMSEHHDWGTHYLGWAYYKNEPWTFPLGDISGYNYPIGTNIGFTDSIPIFALFFKIFQSLLPADFQYFGLWLLLCFLLNGVYTFKILQLYKVNLLISFIAVVFIITNPVLIFRGLHPALCAQWLILGSFYCYLKPTTGENVNQVHKHQMILILISAAVTPYLAAMIIGFSLILPIKNYFFEKSITLRRLILYPIIAFATILGFWMILGILEFGGATNLASVDSFNLCSFNLNSFVNGYGHFSEFIPDLGMVNSMQYEGFAYLGAGLIILSIVSLISLITIFRKFGSGHSAHLKAIFLLIILCGLMLLFAITNEFTIGQKVLFRFEIPQIIETIGYTFRASGRFAWPFYYLIIIFSILIFDKIRIKTIYKITTLSLLLALQIFDINNLITYRDLKFGAYDTPLQDEKWLKIFKNFDAVIIYPPFNFNYSMTYNMDYQDVCFLALKSGCPVSNAYLARVNAAKSTEYQSALAEQIYTGQLNSKHIYVTTPDHIANFGNLIAQRKIQLKKLDGFIFIYSNTNNRNIDSGFDNDNTTVKFLDSILTTYKYVKPPKFVESQEPNVDQGKIKFYFDDYNLTGNKLKIRGWAFLNDVENNKGDSIFITLTSRGKSYRQWLQVEKRTDITAAYKKQYLDDAGFNATIFTHEIDPGTYKVGIFIKGKAGQKEYGESDKTIAIQ